MEHLRRPVDPQKPKQCEKFWRGQKRRKRENKTKIWVIIRGVSGTGQTRNPIPTRPGQNRVGQRRCACALARLLARLALPRLPAHLASPHLPAPIFLTPVSHLPPSRLPSSPASLPCLRSPAVSASFPVSVLPPSPPPSLSPFSCRLAPHPSRPSRASASASPSSPSLSPLRLYFFSVGEAAVKIQLRRSPLSRSNSGDPASALPAVELSRSSSGAPAPTLPAPDCRNRNGV
ncbi:hypothetical protein ACLOJK_021916 [Asimina triloba]